MTILRRELGSGPSAVFDSVELSDALDMCFETELAAAHPKLWFHGSIDGMWVFEASAPTDETVQAAGLAIFFGSDGRYYLAPFELAATFAADGRSLTCYELRFGVRGRNARLELTPSTDASIVRSRMVMFRPRARHDWAFAISG